MNVLNFFQETTIASPGLKLGSQRSAAKLWAAVLGTAAMTLVWGTSAQAASFSGLGRLPGRGTTSVAFGVSADGSTVVGQSGDRRNNFEAFRWTEAGGMVGLGDLPGGDFGSVAFGVSADGSTIVGQSEVSCLLGGCDTCYAQAAIALGRVAVKHRARSLSERHSLP